MTFRQAREVARTGLHIRRPEWDDKWLAIVRGTWWCQSSTFTRPVRATDYTEFDLRAGDWTTIPLPLAACPIDPAIGSTGGGSFPPLSGPGSGGSGSAGGGTSGGGPSGAPTAPDDGPVLPAPDDPGVSVRFSGLIIDNGSGRILTEPTVNTTRKCRPAGVGSWETSYTSGRVEYYGPTRPEPWQWTVSIVKGGGGLFEVTMTGDWNLGGGFQTATPRARGVAISNTLPSGTYPVGGGTATVL